MNRMTAEVIAIGDELTSGVRLDTNSQWLSRQLEQLGLHVLVQTTVGDDQAIMASVLEAAARRADIVVCSGGLGPTADDLTRHALADVAGVDLVRDDQELERIESIYRRRDIPMPVSNQIQAWLPAGARQIPNPEGTAAGIDLTLDGQESLPACRVFALPGVPAEMKAMWTETVEPRLRQSLKLNLTTHHHTLHCFGIGESAVEEMIPDLLTRGRDPLVGITASAATISLRVSTRADSIEQCEAKMEPTLASIRQRLGELVFGENGQQLEDVVVDQLRRLGKQIVIFDFGLRGDVARRLSDAEHRHDPTGPEVISLGQMGRWNSGPTLVEFLRQRTLADHELGLAIGPVDRSTEPVQNGTSFFELACRERDRVESHRFRYGGHSAWRETRAVKDVLNTIRHWQSGDH